MTVRRVDAANGRIYTIGGGGTSMAEAVPALTAAQLPYMLCINSSATNIYYSDSNNLVRRITYPVPAFSLLPADSFSVNIVKQCSGLQIMINTNHYSGGMAVRTWFGDAQSALTTVTSGCMGAGTATINHTYHNSGTYTMKQILYDGTVPVDSMRFTYQHTMCNAINIQMFCDANGNHMKDSAEEPLYLPIEILVDSNGTNIGSLSVTSGFYYVAYGNIGDIYKFRVTKLDTGLVVDCPVSGIISDTLSTSLGNRKVAYFGVIGTSSLGIFDFDVHAAIDVTGRADQNGNIYVTNHSFVPTNATITLSHSAKYNGIARTGDPSTITPNTITWNLTGLSGSNRPVSLWYATWSTSLLTIADTVHTNILVTPLSADRDLVNNYFHCEDTVRSGCDPNAISVSPAGCVPSSTDKLQYTIHFENTGNDTAFNIHVLDTLSDNLDAASLRIELASAKMDFSLIKEGGYTIAKFDFPGINLLDSSHHGLCDGAVFYHINKKPGLADGAIIENRAGIYFDINDVVMTNTVQNSIGCPLSVSTVSNPADVQIYPNPTATELILQTESGVYQSYIIANTIGQQVMQGPIVSATTKVDARTLPSGVYYITLKGDNGSRVEKVVKW